MRKWRVGTISMGILLVATGILLLLGEIKGISGAMLILRWWPVILIVLGVEILGFIFSYYTYSASQFRNLCYPYLPNE